MKSIAWGVVWTTKIPKIDGMSIFAMIREIRECNAMTIAAGSYLVSYAK